VNGIGRMICSMWRPTAAEAINRWTPREKGAPNRAKNPWADPNKPADLGPFWAGSGPSSSPIASCMIPYLCALACGPLTSFRSRLRFESLLCKLCCFLVESLKTCTLTLRSSGHLESCSLRVWLLSAFMIFFQSAWWTYSESLLFSVDFLRKHWTPKLTCKSELVIYGGLVPVVRIINQYQH
jgi:hypothetical protein